MATFVTVFAATDRELDRAFPGWPRPAERPVLVREQDTSSGEYVIVKRWVPRAGEATDEPAAAHHPAMEPLAPILPPESEFEQHMEERAPPVIRSVPHACLKNLRGCHLQALARGLLGEDVEAVPARITPDGFPIDCLGHQAAVALASQPAERLPYLASRWAADSSLGFEGERDALWTLRRIHALARLSVDGERRQICLWVEE